MGVSHLTLGWESVYFFGTFAKPQCSCEHSEDQFPQAAQSCSDQPPCSASSPDWQFFFLLNFLQINQIISSKLPYQQYYRSHEVPNLEECERRQGGTRGSQRKEGGSWWAGSRNGMWEAAMLIGNENTMCWKPNLGKSKLHGLTSYKEGLGPVLPWEVLPRARRRWARWRCRWLRFLLRFLLGFGQDGVGAGF